MKTREEIFDGLRDMLETDFEIDRNLITMEALLGEDLDFDSIDAIDMIAQLQRQLKCRFRAKIYLLRKGPVLKGKRYFGDHRLLFMLEVNGNRAADRARHLVHQAAGLSEIYIFRILADFCDLYRIQ